MDAYLYKYNCPGQWWGEYTGFRQMFTNSVLNDDQAISVAKNDIKKSNGSNECDVTLLVKYKLSIEPIKTYPDITKIPFSEPSKKTRKLSLD
tara:strand:- start:186 stop:461 length:276 start_codon:yes stop_codon:yes gene_type:complete